MVIQRAALVTFAVVLFGCLALIGQLRFLKEWRVVLEPNLHQYLRWAGIFVGLFTLNVFAGCVFLFRKLMLGDTGRRLEHIERQLRTGNFPQSAPMRVTEE